MIIMLKKKGFGNIALPEFVKLALIMTTVVIVLSLIYLMFKNIGMSSRGLF